MPPMSIPINQLTHGTFMEKDPVVVCEVCGGENPNWCARCRIRQDTRMKGELTKQRCKRQMQQRNAYLKKYTKLAQKRKKTMTRKKKPAALKITSVSFHANAQMDGKYQHVHIEATAGVGPGENPSDVLDGLKDFVAAELRRAKGEEKIVTTPGRFRV